MSTILDTLSFSNGIEVIPYFCRVERNGTSIKLTNCEMRILLTFLWKKETNQEVNQEELLECIVSYSDTIDFKKLRNNLHVHIRRLRKKIQKLNMLLICKSILVYQIKIN